MEISSVIRGPSYKCGWLREIPKLWLWRFGAARGIQQHIRRFRTIERITRRNAAGVNFLAALDSLPLGLVHPAARHLRAALVSMPVYHLFRHIAGAEGNGYSNARVTPKSPLQNFQRSFVHSKQCKQVTWHQTSAVFLSIFTASVRPRLPCTETQIWQHRNGHEA